MAAKKPWYADGVRFDCAQTGKCCTAHGKYNRVYLDDDEAAAVAKVLGITLAQLEEEHCWFEDGWRLVKFKDDACRFLEGKSCGVYEARPIQCKTWPFWKENLDRRTWKRDVEGFCKGVGRGRTFSQEEIEAIADE